MTFYVENESQTEFPFDVEEVAKLVCDAALQEEGCPYEVQINIVLTDNAGIRELNRECRGIDKETDVLSFPNLEFEMPGDFSGAEEQEADCFDPDSGELVLGDIIVNAARVKEQAEAYGHSERREFAFLLAHSMYHLCGYDHMEAEEAAVMEEKQERVLQNLQITRDER